MWKKQGGLSNYAGSQVRDHLELMEQLGQENHI